MRVLFVAEAVTLAHFARPAAMATALAQRWHDDVVLAVAGSASEHLRVASPVRQLSLPGIGAAAFASALKSGAPVCNAKDLARFVEDDMRLFEEIRPDVVVGDFRLSLSVSARIAALPYVAIANAYWSPSSSLPLPLPVLDWTAQVPLPIAQALFGLGRRIVVPRHTRPLNKVRVDHGLPSLGNDLRRTYTDADFVVYADDASIFMLKDLPESHRCIGPIVWAPNVELPSWWPDFRRDCAVIYVTMGSSGSTDVLTSTLSALAQLDVTIIASTAGARLPDGAKWPNVHVAPFLPGNRAAEVSTLVVCNGGSMACQQSFLAGRPVLGIAHNMDQFLNMSGVVAAGAGLCLRADRATGHAVKEAALKLLGVQSFTTSAAELGCRMAGADPAAGLREVLLRATAR